MKIGEFSRRNHITQDAIRHYIDLGLLVVDKRGSRYHFTEQNNSELQDILMLKELDFSLNEIQSILCFNRLEGQRSNDFRSFLLSLLERNRERVSEKLKKFVEVEQILRRKIEELNVEEYDRSKRMGFPLSSLSMLRCPACRRPLQIADGSIEHHMLLQAEVFCGCGYQAMVEDGIFIDRRAVKTRIMPTKKEFVQSASPQYINLLYNGTTTLIDYIQAPTGSLDYVLELDSCVGRFLMRYIEHLKEGTTYILLSTDLERLTSLKHNLEREYADNQFIFLCCDLTQLPLAQGSIDRIVSQGMLPKSEHTDHQFLPALVSPLLKPQGLFAGAFWHLGAHQNPNRSFPVETKVYIDRKEITEEIEKLDLSPLDVEELGPVVDCSPYLIFRGQEQYLMLYAGVKHCSYEVLSRPASREVQLSKHRMPNPTANMGLTPW
ncbi:MerR family transcriptional regulator [Paenibacillus sanguinis]|uniref:MerR family transcriptional regulator n=1 Tax=Paenibacillus sanguinis TaxID=225906 RepID=UPI000369653C|nr:MerR family transcriptional regulator [Paenibacillus sanguinis]